MCDVTHSNMHRDACIQFFCATLFFSGLFPQKSPINSGFFTKRDLQLTASYMHSHALESGEDAEDAVSCGSLSAKEPLIIEQFCGK